MEANECIKIYLGTYLILDRNEIRVTPPVFPSLVKLAVLTSMCVVVFGFILQIESQFVSGRTVIFVSSMCDLKSAIQSLLCVSDLVHIIDSYRIVVLSYCTCREDVCAQCYR